jgi:hypothetical protein
MPFTSLILTVGALIAVGVALLWANQTRNRPMFVAIAVALFVAAEFVMGWWALPIVGLLLGLIGARRAGVVPMVGVAAVAAWALLFAWTAMHGNLGNFMHALAASMKLGPNLLLSVTAGLPVLLAALAARVGAGLRPEAAATTALNG